MIAIDIRMPDNCAECPFAKFEDGRWAWACEIKAYKHNRKYVSRCVNERTKPDNCPLMEIKEER